jgi:hypothetical protein
MLTPPGSTVTTPLLVFLIFTSHVEDRADGEGSVSVTDAVTDKSVLQSNGVTVYVEETTWTWELENRVPTRLQPAIVGAVPTGPELMKTVFANELPSNIAAVVLVSIIMQPFSEVGKEGVPLKKELSRLTFSNKTPEN